MKGIFGDPKAKIIHLHRRQKKQFFLSVDEPTAVSMFISSDVFAISRAVTGECFWSWMFAVSHAGAVVL